MFERDTGGNWYDTDITDEDMEVLEILEEFGYK